MAWDDASASVLPFGPDDAACDRGGERIGAGRERDLAQDVGAGERRGAEQGPADPRQAATGMRGGGMGHDGALRVNGGG
jgi:hypothetical protein